MGPRTTGAPAASKTNPLLGFAAVARRLGFSARTIRRWRKEGRFPNAVRVAGAWRIPEQDVLALVASADEVDETPPPLLARREPRARREVVRAARATPRWARRSRAAIAADE
jgi:predicted DNA-binding transcriptional regulator AlpA